MKSSRSRLPFEPVSVGYAHDGHRVVVDNGDRRGRAANDRITRTGQDHKKLFVGLVAAVAVNEVRDRQSGSSSRKFQVAAAHFLVITAGNGSRRIRRFPKHRNVLLAWRGE